MSANLQQSACVKTARKAARRATSCEQSPQAIARHLAVLRHLALLKEATRLCIQDGWCDERLNYNCMQCPGRELAQTIYPVVCHFLQLFDSSIPDCIMEPILAEVLALRNELSE